MPEQAAIYQRYDDEVARAATITIQTGTPPDDLVNYGPDSLVDDNPARVAKIDSTTGAWLFAYAAKQPVQIMGLIHHDFDASADVKIQGNATDSWGAPSFSASFTIPSWLGTGTRRWPVNPWLDLTEQGGYDATGFLFWRLVVTGNSQNLQLGQVWFGETLRRFDHNYDRGAIETPSKPMIEQVTPFGVRTLYSRGTTLWRFDAHHVMPAAAQAADAEAHWYDTDGRGYPWLFVPDGLVNRCYLVRFVEPAHAMVRPWNTWYRRDLIVEELARGLRPGT